MNEFWNSTPKEMYYFAKSKLLRYKQLEEFSQEKPCVFVLSTGRAGTQTLSALLGISSNVQSYHEPLPKLYCLSKIAYGETGSEMMLKALTEGFIIARRKLLNNSLRMGKGYIETSPQATFLAPVIRAVIPNVKFIHIVREPKEVIRSAMRRKWYNGNRLDNCRIEPTSTSLVKIKWDSATPFEKNVWLWAETNEWILRFSEELPVDQYIRLRAEDIFSNHYDTLDAVFRFCGSKTEKPNKVRKILSKRLNFQNVGDFPVTDLWSASMQKQFGDIAGDLALKFGY